MSRLQTLVQTPLMEVLKCTYVVGYKWYTRRDSNPWPPDS